jgi:hypothetical protein
MSVLRLQLACREAHSLLNQLEQDLAWDVAPAKSEGLGIRGGVSNPTLAAVVDTRGASVRRWRVLAARRLERAIAELRLADEATGAACLAAETRPPDHVRAPYNDTFPDGRPDLEDAHAAKARRTGRGEGWGSA